VRLGIVIIYGGNLEFLGTNLSVASFETQGNEGAKITIGTNATFTTPLPTIPAQWEVVDLRATIPTGDYNRTQLGIPSVELPPYAKVNTSSTTISVGANLLSGLLVDAPRNLEVNLYYLL
jgi:hypothetical protein